MLDRRIQDERLPVIFNTGIYEVSISVMADTCVTGSKSDFFKSHSSSHAGNFPFAELKARAYINPVAHTSDKDPDFSARLREGHP
jgi:hypothetical protein